VPLASVDPARLLHLTLLALLPKKKNCTLRDSMLAPAL
jgi:hypothetical protein